MKSFCLKIIILFLSLSVSAQNVGFTNPKLVASKHYLTVRFKLSDATQSDTLKMYLYTVLRYNPLQETASLNQDGLFVFKVPVSASYGYFYIEKKIPLAGTNLDSVPLATTTQYYYWTAGDDILIDLTKTLKNKNDRKGFYKVLISGKGAEKYKLAVIADSIFNHTSSAYVPAAADFDFMDKPYRIDSALKFLNSQHKKASQMDIEVLKANILIGHGEINFRDFIRNFITSQVKEKKLVTADYLPRLQALEKSSTGKITLSALARSFYLSTYACEEAAAEYIIIHPEKIGPSWMNWNGNITVEDILPIIETRYFGVVRDVIITNLFFSGINISNPKKTSLEASMLMSSPQNRKQFQKLMHSHNEGALAYDFNLPDTAGKYHSLKSLRGKVVYQDFSYYGCGGCVGLYQNVIKDVEDHFKDDPNVVFVNIDIDANIRRVKQASKDGKYNSSLSLNLYTDGKGTGHDIIKYYSIATYPEVLLIDKTGRIARFETDDIKTKDGLIKQIDRLLKE